MIILKQIRLSPTTNGNPDGDDVPNKKFYDPRVWLREGEKSFVERLKQAFGFEQCEHLVVLIGFIYLIKIKPYVLV